MITRKVLFSMHHDGSQLIRRCSSARWLQDMQQPVSQSLISLPTDCITSRAYGPMDHRLMWVRIANPSFEDSDETAPQRNLVKAFAARTHRAVTLVKAQSKF